MWRLLVCIALSVALPSLGEVPPSQNSGQRGKESKTNAGAQQNAPAQLPSTVNVNVTGRLQVNGSDNRGEAAEQKEHPSPRSFWEFTLTDVLLAFFTGGLVWVGIRQERLLRGTLKATKRAANAAKDSASVIPALQRAFVSLKQIWKEPVFVADSPHEIRGWRFIPIFENSGSTPTRDAVMHFSYRLEDSPLPEPFDFPDKWPEGEPKIYSRFFIPPKTEKWCTALEFHIVELANVRSKSKYLTMWGWFDYNDVFPDTPRHRTEFAVSVAIRSDPRSQNMTVEFRELSEFNGMDGECDRQPRPYVETRPPKDIERLSGAAR